MEARVDVGLILRDARRAMRVALAPGAVAADIDEGHFGAAVVSRGEGGEKGVQLCEEHGVGVVGIDEPAVVARTAAVAEAEVVADGARPGVEDPFRSGVFQPRLGAGDAEGDLAAALNPALGGRVECGPVEAPLLWFHVGPWQSQIDRRAAGEPFARVPLREKRAVVLRDVGVVVHRPPHAGVDERAPVVGEMNGGHFAETSSGRPSRRPPG